MVGLQGESEEGVSLAGLMANARISRGTEGSIESVNELMEGLGEHVGGNDGSGRHTSGEE